MMNKLRKQKFIAVNYNKGIWIESTIAEEPKAKEKLARNNPQIILNEAEAKTLLLYLVTEFLK